jgi:hypothetical protein
MDELATARALHEGTEALSELHRIGSVLDGILGETRACVQVANTTTVVAVPRPTYWPQLDRVRAQVTKHQAAIDRADAEKKRADAITTLRTNADGTPFTGYGPKTLEDLIITLRESASNYQRLWSVDAARASAAEARVADLEAVVTASAPHPAVVANLDVEAALRSAFAALEIDRFGTLAEHVAYLAQELTTARTELSRYTRAGTPAGHPARVMERPAHARISAAVAAFRQEHGEGATHIVVSLATHAALRAEVWELALGAVDLAEMPDPERHVESVCGCRLTVGDVADFALSREA